MLQKRIIYNATTGKNEIIEEIVENPIEELPVEIQPTLEEKIEELKEVNNTQDELINISMLATDEIYTMIEPILESIPQNKSLLTMIEPILEVVPQNKSLERGVSKMVDLYVAMIQRGIKTIDQVPLRYREEVRRILEELEK